MKPRNRLTALLCITLFLIIGFQAYWLKDNYERERTTMQIKAGTAFQKSIRKLQGSKLKLPKGFGNYSYTRKVSVDTVSIDSTLKPQQVLAMAYALADKYVDSIKKNDFYSSSVNTSRSISVISNNRPPIYYKSKNYNTEPVLKMLHGLDSLQDTIKLPEIIKAYSATLKQEGIQIPFTIKRIDKAALSTEENLLEATVGFVHPVSYRLLPGNTTPYLLNKIRLPILFSLFLVGVTILSFVILYRNLLKQQRLAVIKNEFISNITHELKTPISTVSIAIEAMKNFNALENPQRTSEYLDIADNELQRLGLLVDKVFKLSMFEQQQVELKYEHFDLSNLIAEVMATMGLQFEKYKANVELGIKGNDFNIVADRQHITSVLYNLLDNALKYSFKYPHVKIFIEEKEKDVLLSIADKGKGIPEVYKEKIFEKFFRVPYGDSHNIKGYGLGLSYVSHIITRHRGIIKVETEINKGSRFIINLPKVYVES